LGGQWGFFELNMMLPLIAYNLLQSIDLLQAVAMRFAELCVDGITANEEHCRSNIERSLMLCTALVPAIGYEAAASLAKEAFALGKNVRELALEKKVLPEDRLNAILDGIVYG
jgi:fumarate hydratase, class II